MQQVANEKEIPLVDIVSAFEAFAKETGVCLYVNPSRDFVHPNATGHKIISEEIVATLSKYNLLGFTRYEKK